MHFGKAVYTVCYYCTTAQYCVLWVYWNTEPVNMAAVEAAAVIAHMLWLNSGADSFEEHVLGRLHRTQRSHWVMLKETILQDFLLCQSSIHRVCCNCHWHSVNLGITKDLSLLPGKREGCISRALRNGPALFHRNQSNAAFRGDQPLNSYTALALMAKEYTFKYVLTAAVMVAGRQ